MTTYKTVDEFLRDLDEDRRSQVMKLREYITETNLSLTEHIKWNAPSYILNGEDRITFNTVNKQQVVKLVFHMGATRTENKKGEPVLKTTEIIKWVSDIRGYATFKSLEEIISKKTEIKQVVRDWLALDL